MRLVVFDVDGVLTDGRVVLGADGTEYKMFHARDGQGLVMLRDSGIQVAVISGRSSPVVAERMAALGIEHVYQDQSEKLPVFESLLNELGLSADETAYVGDDLPDLPVMLKVGLVIAVADGAEQVLKHAHWQTRNSGGRGAVREVCELIMHAKGTLERQYARYISENR